MAQICAEFENNTHVGKYLVIAVAEMIGILIRVGDVFEFKPI